MFTKFILDNKGDFIIVEGMEALLQIVVKKLKTMLVIME